MAIFHKNTLAQVSGFDNPILAGELVWAQKTYWNLSFENSSTGDPIDLTGATIDAQIVRRVLSNLIDTRNGLTFDITDYSPPPSPVNLTITNVDGAAGTCTLVIDDTAWDLLDTDPELKIDATSPVGFSGRVLVSFPASGSTPADDSVIFLLFIVRSDGIVVI
ncbi:hypothetical protein UFOVP1463_18 [uncultured Caudovirales phage]|uniref:Uncharacterized protein n=1 Tax=uncultured Caudovirales phage TaxID=2100421 RepID=A0A6J5QGS9_9CAUD|nr:hypothetical protein UFOVP1102_2 [uncultured Caudovirales phage]CAB4214003.1 hypothetical protein UFOVP1463_18 [uncultured Caudovirales phage]